jgi:sortase A
MRRVVRTAGLVLIAAGIALFVWGVAVWQWEDPFTSAYTAYEQRKLDDHYADAAAAYDPPASRPVSPTSPPVSLAARRRDVAAAARAYRRGLERGEPLGRLRIPRLDLDMVVVQGTDEESLKKGPGHYPFSFLPGEGRLIYLAGHRTTYAAPFSRIDRLRKGDRVTMELPYATVEYRITGHRIVPATATEVLRSGHKEVLALQACHPRFFASHRWIAYAEPVKITPRGGRAFRPTPA